MRIIIQGILVAAGTVAVFGQGAETLPVFEAADVHVSAKSSMPFGRTMPVRGGRYEVKNATMVDLIRFAYGFDTDKILEGPNWLELDRFDVTAKVPADSTADMHKQMLQALLRDRFKLVVHKDTKPLPAYALVAGKKPLLKEASGKEQNGCRPASGGAGAPGGGGGRIMLEMNGTPMTINLGPGMTIQYECRNVTMEEFAANLRSMIGASLGSNAILDETGLKGNWNFDLRYSLQFFGPAMANQGERVSFTDAVEKQLGLKLEERQVPTPVLVVDSVNRKPGENPPKTAELLPPIPAPTEFEVASVKLSDPGGRIMAGLRIQPGGRVTASGTPLGFLVNRAFNTFNSDEIVGIPDFANNERIDINAKLPEGVESLTGMDMDAVAPLLLALLKDRFKLEYHKEERPVTAYSLVAGKPKLKKADPASRIFCRNSAGGPGTPPGTRVMRCQNTTMAQLAERLQGMGPELNWPVADVTGLEGGWDFTVTFSMRPMMAARVGGGRGGEPNAAPGAVPEASDPAEGYTIFEAVEKQLGLKLEKQKRTMPVIVIDHLEQKPTEN